eukprot:TRINITY_DN1749_c0_g1_i7.p1 TRINITY_DN1749_c0_g1~~TRINITY_DN1749_c0_g1_i7.p1  ORF type:complete len:179 (-),score=16.82 TRINITY_DN1749_c0_g1_i7:69-605(-)
MCIRDRVKTKNIHQLCGIAVDNIMKKAISKRTLDNITVVMICFESYYRRNFPQNSMETGEDSFSRDNEGQGMNPASKSSQGHQLTVQPPKLSVEPTGLRVVRQQQTPRVNPTQSTPKTGPSAENGGNLPTPKRSVGLFSPKTATPVDIYRTQGANSSKRGLNSIPSKSFYPTYTPQNV